MKRLTKYVLDNYENITGSIVEDNNQALLTLAEYENFMEENGFESLEDVKRLLETISVALGDTNSERIILREDYKLISKFNEEYKQEIKQLKHDLAVRDKALELVCNLAIDLDNNNNTFGYSNLDKYFIEQAEKELKGEK